MRSTRGKSRASRKQHYTAKARITAPLHSNSDTTIAGQSIGLRPNTVASGTRSRGIPSMNTNTQLSRGGISSYYRAREGWGQ